MSDSILFSPTQVGSFKLRNHMVMAPMTRSRALDDGTPTPVMGEYYEQRSGAGLIVSEGVYISAQAQGFLNVPGIYTDAHEEAWRDILQRVHAAGGTFFMQLWHVGRIGHQDNMREGLRPVAPSAIAHDRTVVTRSGMQAAPVPHELTHAEVRRTIEDYAKAAKRAIAAGVDGIEIHGANGYLPGQFLHQTTNHRNDAWGGTLEKRARFMVEIARACADAIGPGRVGIRLSPFSVFNGARSEDDRKVYEHLLPALAALNLLYVHVVTAEVAGNLTVQHAEGAFVPDVVGFTRTRWPHALIAAGGFDRQQAEEELQAGRADLVAFGRDFIGNPDLPERLAKGHPLVERRPGDWYGSSEAGYTDYPRWSTAGSAKSTD